MDFQLPHLEKEFQINFEFYRGICEYLAGFEPGTLWDRLGTLGKRTEERRELQEQRAQKLQERVQRKSFRDNLQDFSSEVERLFNDFVAGERTLWDEYLEDRRFYFNLGVARSGGTYTFVEISEIIGWPWRQTHQNITHDANPDGVLYDELETRGGMGWRKPPNFYSGLFDLCQILVYVHRVTDPGQDVALKNWVFCHGVGLLDWVFGEKARYVVTVRHPAATTASRAEQLSVDQNPLDPTFLANQREQWFSFYGEIVRDTPYAGSIHPVLFGRDMEDFLAQLNQEHGGQHSIEPVNITERSYDPDPWQSDGFEKRMDRLVARWEAHGHSFPRPRPIR